MTREQLEQLARRWRNRIAARDAIFAGAAACIVAALAAFWLQPATLVIIAIAAFCVAACARLFVFRAWQIDAAHVARHLDRAFPQLEESSALWLRSTESLTLVERLQRARADEAVRRLSSATSGSFAAPPRQLLRLPAMLLGAAVAVLVVVIAWRLFDDRAAHAPVIESDSREQAARIPAPGAPVQPPQIKSAELLLAPPAYTGRAERRVSGLNAEVEEGARVTWSLTLDRQLDQLGVRLGASERDVLPLRAEVDGTMRASKAVQESVIYGIEGLTSDGTRWRPHELYSLKVIKDRPPALKIVQPTEARTVIPPAPDGAGPRATVEVLVTDDYRLADAYLIATVAKGTGEAVKFREQKIAFELNEPTEQPANGWRLAIDLDLKALGLEPGDELYFHVEARDNREPSKNHARSETRFIVLKGPEAAVSTPGAGVSGLNLIPQYFRSQRQIIIDTEKLVADQPTLGESEFRNRANNLAIDQQLLRQRYGEFLGEEADHGDETASAPAEQETHSADDGHDHSHDAPAAAAPRTQEEIAAQFGHQHDSQDEATLFDRETKGTMRQALAAMWEAERFLRVAQPREALGPENRALEIIKALQQADREYVQRVGFEAAPIDFAARRLRGEVEDVPERTTATQPAATDDEQEDAVRELLRAAPWNVRTRPLSPAELDLARRVESSITKAANEHGAQFLAALEELRRLASGELLPDRKQSALEAALLRMLPAAERQPANAEENSTALAERYFRNLERRQ